jgi:hypothetical protein
MLRMAGLLAVVLSGGCQSTSPFEEVNEQGLTEFVGTVSPSEVVVDGNQTAYHFDPADGPMCYRGAPFGAATRTGESDALMIFMQGGGACWSTFCQAFDVARPEVSQSGILNTGLDINPVRSWNVGFVPYCDGSLFAGDADIDEDGDGVFERRHHGLQNLSAALDVIQGDFPEPSRILLVGSSAGAYGTIIGAMLIRHLYPTVDIEVVSDGGIGLGLPDQPWFIQGILEEWRVERLVPESCPDCFSDGHVTGVTSWALDRDPKMSVYGISSKRDVVIGGTFLGMSGAAYEAEVLEETEELITRHGAQYHRYIFSGEKHTTTSIDSTVDLENTSSLPYDFDPDILDRILGTFDQTEIEGMNVARWLEMGLNKEEGFESLVAP